ncbi:MAG: AbrB/MazE/SpoVT family DNA-binding domain-containing protein [Planctomycetes bacterium]|nr:AbrB/MazE/SpoVT family DNA-binding domain-containing protein [Planctomycetota bacterium]
MNVSVVRIGNSRGIRIPKRILEQCRISGSVDLRVKGSRIILEPVRRRVREGWEEAARQARQRGDDVLLLPDVFAEDVEPEA